MNKICKICSKKFEAVRRTEKVCSVECSLEYPKMMEEKRIRKDARERKESYYRQHIPTLKKKVEKVFNEYIRKRDEGKPCISCGCPHGSMQWHAGHFISVGESQYLRFNENNVHGQCVQCNNFLSGNIEHYEPNLRLKIGDEDVEALKSDRKKTYSYTAEELNDLLRIYKTKLKELQ